MKVRPFLFVAVLGAALSSAAHACPKGELEVSFSNIATKTAFALIADAAGLRPQFEGSIEGSTPWRFQCTPWRVAAESLAMKYNLRLRIEDGVMHVSPK